VSAAALGLGALALYRLRMRQVTRQLNVRFEERLAERTRIAQELHDTLLQGFLSASMQVHVATDLLPPDAAAKPMLARVQQLMKQVIEEGRNAVRGLRSSGNPSLDLERAFSGIQQEMGEIAATTDLRITVEGHARPLHPISRDEMYRIGREAVINAFRHARAKNIDVELKYTARHLRLLVRDDGVGIDPKIVTSGRDGHFGLAGMRERADQIGARLQIWSSAATGTEVELYVPGRTAFVGHRSFKLPWLNGRRDNRNGAGK
jgi:signal transduction histidine kinase